MKQLAVFLMEAYALRGVNQSDPPSTTELGPVLSFGRRLLDNLAGIGIKQTCSSIHPESESQ